MGVYIQQNGTRKPIGGGSQELITKVAVLEQIVNGLETALAGKLGIGKVTQSTAVTEAGYAADARQLNPAVSGSLANCVQSMEQSLNIRKGKGYVFSTYATVVGGILTTTSVPAPANGYNVDILSIDLYGERMLTEDEKSRFLILDRDGGFNLTSTDEGMKNLAANRILILGYSFI